MNLQLIKIKKHNVFDYNLLSEFMVNRNGKLIFNAGFGYTGEAGKIKKKDDDNLNQKFERKFQVKSILKSYKETFHLRKKSKKNNFGNLTLPHMNKIRESSNITLSKNNLRKIKSRNNFNSGTSNRLFDLKSATILNKNNQNIEGDKNNENLIDYKNYFSHTIDSFIQGTTPDNYEKELMTNKSTSFNHIKSNYKRKKLLKNNSHDYIYLFGQNKIIVNNKKGKKNHLSLATQFDKNVRSPFKDYEEFNPRKYKISLRKNFNFFRTNDFRNSVDIKQEYIAKIRSIYEMKKKVKYKFCFSPSHYSVKTIIRKAGFEDNK